MTFPWNGMHIRYEDTGGEGKPLLLLHGWGGSAESWLPVVRDFGQNRRVVALDFPGHGQSDAPQTPMDARDFAEMVAALIQSLGIAPTDIIGHSHGGRVSIVLAAEYPELVGKLVLAGSAGVKKPPTLKGRVRGLVYRALKALYTSSLFQRCVGETRAHALREGLVARFGSRDYKALSPVMRPTFSKLVSQDLSEKLPAIRASTLLVWGDQDTETPLWMGQKMEALIPDAGLAVMSGHGHFAYLEGYAQFRAIIEVFLGRS